MLLSNADKYKELVTVTTILNALHLQMLKMMGRTDEGEPPFRLWLA
jgi:hypothetical protein